MKIRPRMSTCLRNFMPADNLVVGLLLENFFFFKMRGNNVLANYREDRQREHERQQERLKAMAATSDKPRTVSADAMIENLLKDSLKKLPPASSISHLNPSDSELPLWLQCENPAVPDQYQYLWSLVQSTLDLADTQKVSQLLLTSGLQVDILGFIWNLANKTIPGQLTKQEFYIVLALVSLAQTGYTFSNLSVLKLLTAPSIPVLQVDLQKHQAYQRYFPQSLETANINTPNSLTLQSKFFPNSNEIKKDKNYFISRTLSETVLLNELKSTSANPEGNDERKSKGGSKNSDFYLVEPAREYCENSHFPYIGSSPTEELEDDFSAFQSVPAEKNEDDKNTNQQMFDIGDDFTEFQSANIEHLDPLKTVVVNQKKEIPKIPLPKAFSGKFISLKSSILKISPETEKKLKVLSPAETLSSLPESKITASNKVSTSISVLGSNHGIGSRLANHSFNTKQDKTKCHKHHKIKINSILPTHLSVEDDIIFGVKPRSLENVIPKCCPKHSNGCKTVLLKETKIISDNIPEALLNEQLENKSDPSLINAEENTRQIEIPMLGTFNETVLPTRTKSQTSSFDLISVQDDKYSALREIELELNHERNPSLKETNDDFGDFLSADILAPPISNSPSALNQIINSNPDLSLPLEDEKGEWGDWNFSVETNQHLSSGASLDVPQVNIITEDSNFKTENDLFDSFTSFSINEKYSNQISLPVSFLSEQQNYFALDTKGENSSEAFELDEKSGKSENLCTQSKADLTFNAQSNKEIWEFLSSNMKPADGGSFSRHSSLPSLDLKISPTDESEQETVWRKCLDSCFNLIQEGYDIFNSINMKSVLDQVFSAPKTEDYLNYLNTAFQISKRVSQNFSSPPSSQEDLEKFWVRLQDLCFEYNIKLKHDEDNCSEGKIRCNICLRRIGYNVINQGAGSYHPTCANLWVNCIETTLPFSI